MYLFTRARRLDGAHTWDGMAWSTEVAERVHALTDLRVTVWTSFLSPDLGTVVWSAWIEHLGQLAAAFDATMADDGYRDAVTSADELFAGPAQDRVARLLTEPVLDPSPPAYVSVVDAVAANGHVGAAVATGLEIADTASRISGSRTAFLTHGTGDYGGVTWVTGHAGIEDLEQGEEKLGADEAWLQLVDRAGEVYRPGATQRIFRRIG